MTNEYLKGEPTADDPAIRLMEEVATVSTREVVTGRVRVSTAVDRFEELAGADLQSETVVVTRVPVGRQIDAPPLVRTEGDVTIIPIVEEILVVEKRLMLKEEVHIRKTVATERVEEPVSLRRQRAIVERYDENGKLIGPPEPALG